MNCTLNSSLCPVTADAVSFFLFPGGAATHGGTIRKMWIIRGGEEGGGGAGLFRKMWLTRGRKKRRRANSISLPETIQMSVLKGNPETSSLDSGSSWTSSSRMVESHFFGGV